jgi:hypothetical protein
VAVGIDGGGTMVGRQGNLTPATPAERGLSFADVVADLPSGVGHFAINGEHASVRVAREIRLWGRQAGWRS